MNEDVSGNRKLFWKEVSNAKGGNVKSCSKMKDENGRLALGEEEIQRISKAYFEDMYNVDTQEQVEVHRCGFDGIWRGKYFKGEPVGRPEVEVRVGKLKNEKAAGKNEPIREMMKGGGDRLVDWI